VKEIRGSFTLIRFKDVIKEYGDGTKALDDVNLDILKKEFVFIVGPSGAGKTTLVKLMIREEVPSAGKVLVDRQDVSDLPRSELPALRRNIGVVFQDFKLLPSKTAYENVSIALEVEGRDEEEINEIVPNVLSLVNLVKKSDHFPSQLSGGEKQKLSIARALAHEPKILIADEPTGMIDPKSTWEIIDLLKKINSWGTTVIVATHDASIVDKLKKRVIGLEGGKVVRDVKRGKYRS